MLCKKGLAYAVKGSGTYVSFEKRESGRQEAEQAITKTIEDLRVQGFGQADMERLFRELAWQCLPEEEKIKLAWIDCSEELIHDTARSIAENCNVRVTSFLIDEIRENKEVLVSEEFDIYVTTINHYEELLEAVGRLEIKGKEKTEMVVLAVDNSTIASISKLDKRECAAVIFESEWYRYSVECFLKEFEAAGRILYLPIDSSREVLEKGTESVQCVIFPQDDDYRDGLIGELKTLCRKKEIPCFPFIQALDKGSLLHLRKRVYEIWQKKNT